MAAVNPPLINFSGGILGKHLHGRVDVPSYANSAAIMENWRPQAQGIMTRRPPMRYVDSFTEHAKKGRLIPFIYDINDGYVVLATENQFKFYTNDGAVVVADPVSATIAEGTFSVLHPDRADASGITASSTAAGGTTNLIDESATTYWQADGSATATLTFDLTTDYTLRDIWLTAATAYAENAPKAFTLHGSATGAFSGEQVLILSVTGETDWSAEEKRKYRITLPGSYRYYRLTMTDSEAGAGDYALGEVSLYDSPWLDNSTGNSVVTITAGLMYLDSDGGSIAIAEQQVAITETDTIHVLTFDVVHGPINLRIGTTSGGTDVLDLSDLGTGHHRIGFTPGAGAVYIQFRHGDNAGRILDNVSILDVGASAAPFTISHPYSQLELADLSWQQQGNILYITHPDHETRRLERYGSLGWSLVYNRTRNGPYGPTNTTQTAIGASDTDGEVVLTADADLFTAADEGALYSITSQGQTRTATATSGDVYTGGIKVTGASTSGSTNSGAFTTEGGIADTANNSSTATGINSRIFNIQISGTGTWVVTLQESNGNENNYVDTETVFTTEANVNYDDDRDNETWYYRLAVKPGDYTDGTVTMLLQYNGGTLTGQVRIISVTSARVATAEVLSELASINASKTWRRGTWNADDGWPVATTAGFGRFWFARGVTIWASVSDDFQNFNEGSQADAAFSVTLAQPSGDPIRWMDFAGVLVIGTSTSEQIGLGNTASEPVGPTNFQTVPTSEEGGARIKPVRSEGSVLYAHRSLKKLMQFTQAPQALSRESYTSIDLTELAPELLDDEIVSMAIQREPQRRVFVVLKSGRMGELLYRREIEVTAWNLALTDGRVEDVCVIQQEDQDVVYLIVRRRNPSGAWQRYIERYGNEYTYTWFDAYHLDSAISRDLTRPASTIELTRRDATAVVTSDEAGVFASGDVGKTICFPTGRGVIASFSSGSQVLVTMTTPLDGEAPLVIPAGRWGIGTRVTSVTGADHLAGQEVRVMADGCDLGVVTVGNDGSITLPGGASAAVIHAGLAMESRWQSLKLAYGAQKGTALGMKKAITTLAAVLLHRTGATLTHGPSFDRMTEIDTRGAHADRDHESIYDEPLPLYTGEINGEVFASEIRNDPRLCLAISSAEPATVVGIVPTLKTVDA